MEDFAHRLSETDNKVVLVSLEAPWGFDDLPSEGLLLTYGCSSASREALAKVLCGNVEPEGELPVSLGS